MALTVTHHYASRLGPFEKITIEVLNDRYGRVTTTRLRKSRNYAIELATLTPEAEETLKVAWQWLAAGVVALLALVGLGYYVINGESGLPLPATLGSGLLLLALTLFLLRMFFALSARHIIFRARYSDIPLLEIPIPVSDRKQGQAFAKTISQLAQKNLARVEHYSEADLRAGELRMLRRLAEEGALASGDYDKAKTVLLRLAS